MEPVGVELSDQSRARELPPVNQHETSGSSPIEFSCLQSLTDPEHGDCKAVQLEHQEPHTLDFLRLQRMLDAQRDKIYEQLQELQKVVVLQCRITGTNPLAQEMAAAVLEKRIGKKFGESLTPKALKCLYNVFSIKDTITKKEAREISASCGATVTQVREFFSGQRSRVRKVIQSSHLDQGSDISRLRLPYVQLSDGSRQEEDILPFSSQKVDNSQCTHLSLLDVFHGKTDGLLSKLHAAEKADHLINVMHKETTFTGQSQLTQVILQAHDAVLRCFMARGGLQQIIKWLVQAAAEEQTSLIRLLLKAITQLPLGSALPRHMSLLLQTINKLRFYRAQDVASRARLLLSRWSRFFKSTQNGKMVSFTGLTRTSQTGQKRSRDATSSHSVEDSLKKKPKAGIMVVDSSRQSSDVVSSSLTEDKPMNTRENSDNIIEANKTKKRLGSFLIQGDRAKEKRKVQLFEEARAAIRRRDTDSAKSSSFESSSRPLSADDIKKAKQRAYFLNNANSQKPSSLISDRSLILDLSTVTFQRGLDARTIKNNGNNIAAHEPSSGESCLETALPPMEEEYSEVKLRLKSNPDTSDGILGQIVGDQVESNHELNVNPFDLSMGVKQSERCGPARLMDLPSIQWATPSRVTLDPGWKVASGEQSTEVEVQSKRLKSEQEAIYLSPECIPPNPEEPAERGCLFVDDILVPEILLEALDEESQEKDCSLQSPRDFESAWVKGQEADSQKLNTFIEDTSHGSSTIEHRDMLSSSMEGVSQSVELKMALKDTHTVEVSSKSEYQGLNYSYPLACDLDTKHNFGVFSSKLTLATPVGQLSQAGMEIRNIEKCSSEANEQSKGKSSLQLRNQEPALIYNSLPLVKASEAELFTSSGEKIIISPPKKDFDKTTSLSPANMQVPLLLDDFVDASSGNKTSGVDLSGLSKQACVDMLTIVLQQLADNGKGSGADLELLSVFLKNPQLVAELMSSQAGPSGKDLQGAHAASGTFEDLSSQFEKLIGRNIAQMAKNSRETGQTAPYASHVTKPPLVALAVSQVCPPPAPLLPRSVAAVDPVVFDSTPFLKHPPGRSADISRFSENSASHSSEYDWSQPYDQPLSYMQQSAELARPSIHNAVALDNCSSLGGYHQPTAGYNQPQITRASQSQNPTSLTVQSDWRVPSSMFMYGGGHGQLNPPAMHSESQERAMNRKSSLSVMDMANAPLLQNLQGRGPGISDGILPVPDVAANNHRVQPSNWMHETHPLHAGKPVFVPDVRESPPMTGNQMLSHYPDNNFRPQLVSSSRPPYLPHGCPPASFVPNPIRPQTNPPFWHPSPPHFSQGRHVRPGWREG